MPIGSADLHKAINTLWDDESLDDGFTQFWASGKTSEFYALNDQEAAAGQPFPYCVYEITPGDTTDRMSGHSVGENHEIRDIPIEFRVHARQDSSSDKTAKQIAADRAAEILKAFGGHPTQTPKSPSLDNGSFLIMQYQNDYGVLTGDTEYQWIISYLARIDVPVAN